MKQHKVLNLTSTDVFNADDYPSLSEELAAISEHTAGMSPVHKDDIIVSYLKDHSIKTTWIAANPLLTSLITSNVLPTATIEALFQSSRSHPVFSKDLEIFMRKRLAVTDSTL